MLAPRNIEFSFVVVVAGELAPGTTWVFPEDSRGDSTSNAFGMEEPPLADEMDEVSLTVPALHSHG